MKNSLFKKIIAVSLAFATLMFAGCQKDEPVNNDNPSENISQNVDEETALQEVESTDKDEETTKQEETSKKPVEDKTNKQEATETKKPVTDKKIIDLKSVDLSQYGISSNNKISEPYETLKGNFYYVCDYGAGENDKFKTYRFFTTDHDVMCAEIEDLVTDSYINPIGYIFYDINNDGVEELIVHEKIHIKEFRVFTFKDGEMLFVGEITDEHGYLYGRDDTVTAVTREMSNGEESEPYSMYFIYKLTNNKLMETGHGSCVPISELDDSQFGKKLVFNEWQDGWY